MNRSPYSQLDNHDGTSTSRLSTPSIADPKISQNWTNPFLSTSRTYHTLHSSGYATHFSPSVSLKAPTRNGYPPIFDAEYRSFHISHSNSVIPNQPSCSSDRLSPIHELKCWASLLGVTTCQRQPSSMFGSSTSVSIGFPQVHLDGIAPTNGPSSWPADLQPHLPCELSSPEPRR